MSPVNRADADARRVESLFPEILERLKNLVRISSVSFPGFDPLQIKKSAEACAALCRELGLETRIVGSETHPAVIAHKLADERLPTVLLYAHHDVQPPMRAELWHSPAFEPEEREGRLYGRGSADDKAGVMVHFASLLACMEGGGLPVNPLLVLEGADEIGSPGLEGILGNLPLHPDAAIVADLANFDTGIPTLTVSLRGMVGFEVEVRALERPLHSGMWSGPIPDPVQGLAKAIASLTDEQGKPAVPGLTDGLIPPEAQERDAWASLPFGLQQFRTQAGISPGVRMHKDSPEQVLTSLWREPSITVTRFLAGSKDSGNVLQDSAKARISLRLAPGMEWRRCQTLLEDHLRAHLPWGLQMVVEREEGADPWQVSPSSPVVQSALSALEAGFGRPGVLAGCGASIPGAEIFARAFGPIPVLLTGLEDPRSNAHGEDESLDLKDFASAIRAQIYLFHTLSTLMRK